LTRRMAALCAGSKRFVPRVLRPSMVTEMYGTLNGIGIPGIASRTFQADIRDYARWEYGRNDVAWLYARANFHRKPRRHLWVRLGALLRRDVRPLAAPSPESRPR